MRVLITGSTGQLGQALQRSAPENLAGEPLEWFALGRNQLDLADDAACRRLVLDLQPDWLINAAAYTGVDNAEIEPDLARRVNAVAPAAFANALSEFGGQMLQLSTDFVFDGHQGFPYSPEHPVKPLGVYGFTKAEGEKAVLNRLGGSSGRAYVLRTSWVYGPVGKNFLLTMLRLHAQRQKISVVADQIGCPTSTNSLAKSCWRLLELATYPKSSLPSVLHWSDAGAASWYDFAVAIGDIAQSFGLIDQSAEIIPIPSLDYPTPAQRPSYSLLDCNSSRSVLGMMPGSWMKELQSVLKEIRMNGLE